MELKDFKSAVLHNELEPGSQLRGGALETAGIDSESLAEGSGECKNFKSSAEGEWKANWKFGGAERNRTADEGFADPVHKFVSLYLCGYLACLYPFCTHSMIC